MTGTGGPKLIENTEFSLYFHGLGGVAKGTGSPRSIENIKISLYSHGLGGVVTDAGGPESLKMQRVLRFFMVWSAW